MKKAKDFFRFAMAAVLVAAFSITFTSCKDDDDDDDVTPTPTESTVLSDKTGDKTLTSDKIWTLDGFVFVENGTTLTIEPGTIVEGKPGQGENASALVVAQGGTIDAQGTADNPIIFTGEGDGAEGNFLTEVRGLWGGLIVLGKATTNNATETKQIEGVPTTETRAIYGGSDDADNSGTIQYVSIRHGGTDIGAGNEINGLTLGAVGSGTTIDYVEVVSNMDDGVEFFGGAPNLKHILVSYVGDDSYDYDEGYHGKGQFWVTIQTDVSDRMGEHDGGPSDNEVGEPYASPMIYNATYIGKGEGEGAKTITFRDNAAGTYANSVFTTQEKGIDFEWRNDKHCTYQMLTEGMLHVKNNVFNLVAGNDTTSVFKVSDETEAGDIPADAATILKAHFEDNMNMFASMEYGIVDGDLTDVVPAANDALTTNLANYDDAWFDAVSYKGAFEPAGSNWADGWTLTFK
jgi:hypothetical protein